jgi:hypothetical protein
LAFQFDRIMVNCAEPNFGFLRAVPHRSSHTSTNSIAHTLPNSFPHRTANTDADTDADLRAHDSHSKASAQTFAAL